MRKNTPRKWLHAILDLLPILIIPIFAIFTRNENSTFAQEITVQENKVVDFNQISKNVITQGIQEYGWYGSQTTLVLNDNIFEATPINNAEYPGIVSPMIKSTANHVYVISCYFKGASALHLNFGGFDSSIGVNLNVNDFNYIDFRFQANYTQDYGLALFVPTVAYPDISIEFYNKINVFDLTQMFGSGNEPSLAQFRSYYPNDFYNFTLSDKQLLKDVSSVTYNDTDIGSQFMYALYKPVDKYFNFNKLFNMEDVYDWLQLNLFEGNAPIPVHIVWNIIVYEFFIDLIFLLYSVFMFIIDFATNMIDSFTRRNK